MPLGPSSNPKSVSFSVLVPCRGPCSYTLRAFDINFDVGSACAETIALKGGQNDDSVTLLSSPGAGAPPPIAIPPYRMKNWAIRFIPLPRRCVIQRHLHHLRVQPFLGLRRKECKCCRFGFCIQYSMPNYVSPFNGTVVVAVIGHR
jgi:hypothetical protein